MTTKMDILIQQATSADIERIANIEIESHFHDSNPLDRILNDLFLNEYKKRWEKKLNDGMQTFLISLAGKGIGFIYYSVLKDTAEIHNIYILPENRRSKLGKRLCLYALEKMRSSSLAKVNVWVVEGRKQIIKFYEALGFRASELTRVDSISKGFSLTERELMYRL